MNDDSHNENMVTAAIIHLPQELNKEKFKERNVKLNKLFINYYKDALLLNAKEYEDFLSKSVEKLPITFRINKMK